MLTQLAIVWVVLPVLSLAAVLACVRLLRGPSLPDRVVSLDLLAAIVIAMLLSFAVGVGRPVFVDIVLAVALLAFLGTVAFAYYVERRGDDE